MPRKKVEKSRYSDKELSFFEKIIDEKLVQAREQLEFYLNQLQEMADDPEMIDDLNQGMIRSKALMTVSHRWKARGCPR